MLPLDEYDLHIFDCDGVILDANDIKVSAMKQAIIDSGFSDEDAQKCSDYFKNNFGKSRFYHVRYFVKDLLQISMQEQELQYEKILSRFSERCRNNYIGAPITPFFNEMLDSLKGVQAVASGSEQSELRDVFRAKGIDNRFRCIMGSPTAKEDNVAKILETVPHSKAVMIGDAVADYVAARANSIDFIAYIPFSNVAEKMKELSREFKFLVLDEWPVSNKEVCN